MPKFLVSLQQKKYFSKILNKCLTFFNCLELIVRLKTCEKNSSYTIKQLILQIMGNLTSEQQFKDKLQEFLVLEENKKTLKIRYKEINKKALIIESAIIKHFNYSENQIENPPQTIYTIKELIELRKRAAQSIFRNIQVEIICKISLNIYEPKRTYDACSKCKKKLLKNRSLKKCLKCSSFQGNETTYSIPVTISDNTGSCQVIIFGEAEKYLGIFFFISRYFCRRL
ncbi:hypothetical protein FGO68_gene1449 [Halteria grandinella]|uniref:Replication factor A C-terminal domain-containing protein n=1 Tax=Halteria grandinella TaxID=5974 RepID=A0A8J8NB03_HALGN|nr:hypothetical protein FGO68_gene1449 [Halteria grandinella]